MTDQGQPCKFCGKPCPPARHATRPRVFCTNACRAAWRLQERNRAVVDARDALEAVADMLATARAEIQRRVDALNDLVVRPRKRRRSTLDTDQG